MKFGDRSSTVNHDDCHCQFASKLVSSTRITNERTRMSCFSLSLDNSDDQIARQWNEFWREDARGENPTFKSDTIETFNKTRMEKTKWE